MAIVLSVLLSSCADARKQEDFLRKTYPKCTIRPATGLVKNQGYDFVIIDSLNNVVAVDFYPFSESEILYLKTVL